MPLLWLILIVLAIATAGYVLGRSRVMAGAGGDSRDLHSLPSYYGYNVALKVVLPSFLLLLVWLLAQPMVVNGTVAADIPESAIPDGSSRDLIMSEVRRTAEGLDNAVAQGLMTEDFARSARSDFNDVTQRLKDAGQIVTAQVTQPILEAAQRYRVMNDTGNLILTALVVLVALAGAAWGLREMRPEFRARNVVERVVHGVLVAAASVAILTTLGIVLSLVFNTIEFFRLYPAWDFFFGTTWSPSFTGRGGSSELGVLPLLWGTFYISIAARALFRQADAGGAGRYSDDCLRSLRAADRGAAADGGLRQGRSGLDAGGHGGDDRRPRHGHHAHPFRQFAVG